MRGLYAIVDLDALERRAIPVIPFAEALLDARPAALQLRAKSGGARATLELLRALAPLAARAGVPLYANDRPDLALLARCDGVHVGQEDVPVGLVRRVASALGQALAVGLSTHDAAQVDAVAEDAPDYLAIGPIFATSSKDNPSAVVGLSGLAALAARARSAPGGAARPIVAIGGITLENAAQVGELADCAAVIGALLPPEEERAMPRALEAARDRARAIHAAVLRGRELRERGSEA
jgi:thiamine-phosphate pyrophosphorylase